MRKTCSSFVAPLALCLVLAGCATPAPVRELASQGALASDQALAQTRGFVGRAQAAYTARAAIVQQLATGDINDAANGDFNAWLAGEAGMPSTKARADQIRKIADQSRATRARIQQETDAKLKQLADAAGPPVEVPAARLAAARKSFIVLSEELTPAQWLEFSWKYAQQVKASLKDEGGAAAPADAPK